MQEDRLGNCSICGKLFVRDHTDYCLDCFHEMERDFKQVKDFLTLEKNHSATIEEVSRFTGVDVKRIVSFIRDGRIYMEDYPNLHYPCAHCGAPIQRQMLCRSCFDQFTSEIDKTLKAEQLLEEMNKTETRPASTGYWKLKE